MHFGQIFSHQRQYALMECSSSWRSEQIRWKSLLRKRNETILRCPHMYHWMIHLQKSCTAFWRHKHTLPCVGTFRCLVQTIIRRKFCKARKPHGNLGSKYMVRKRRRFLRLDKCDKRSNDCALINVMNERSFCQERWCCSNPTSHSSFIPSTATFILLFLVLLLKRSSEVDLIPSTVFQSLILCSSNSMIWWRRIVRMVWIIRRIFSTLLMFEKTDT